MQVFTPNEAMAFLEAVRGDRLEALYGVGHGDLALAARAHRDLRNAHHALPPDDEERTQ
jgi:hypothetical protein